MLGFGILLMVVGGLLATNYRELATKHIRAAQRWSPRLRRNSRDPAPLVLIDRIIGAIFALLGAAMFLLALIDLIVGPGRLIQYGQ